MTDLRRRLSTVLIAFATLAPAGGAAAAPLESPATAVRVGHWLEARGELRPDGVFVSENAEVLAPQRDEVLIGTIAPQADGAGRFLLLGRTVVASRATEWEGVDPRHPGGARVKVEGRWQPPGTFLARTVSRRGEGRERIGGRVEEVRRGSDGVHVRILGFTALLPAAVEHEAPLREIGLAPDRTLEAPLGLDEDDQFGRGLPVARHLHVTGQVEGRVTAEGNFDLDAGEAEDRADLEGSLRLRLEWTPPGRTVAVVEVRQAGLRREDEEDGDVSRDEARLGQTFVAVRDVPAPGWSLFIGRQDFDDPREWVYDQDLDAVRLLASRPRWRLELAASTLLADGSERDRHSTNYLARLSNNDPSRWVAAYALRREFDLDHGARTTHVGVSAGGRWLADVRPWLEAAAMVGTSAGDDLAGWALDVGATWSPDALEPWSFTAGFAHGSGGRLGGPDGTFRQTGFHDNNGKFGGVTSFRYYGELVDPELANLQVLTVGIGRRLARGTSLDLVVHAYRQAEAAAELVDTELDADPDGVHRDLGWEADLALGSRHWAAWDLEVVGSYFAPGPAFADRDEAVLGKLQLRYRF